MSPRSARRQGLLIDRQSQCDFDFDFDFDLSFPRTSCICVCARVYLCVYILSRAIVTKTRVWFGESVYWTFTSRNYN
jgi:hypothetical protein